LLDRIPVMNVPSSKQDRTNRRCVKAGAIMFFLGIPLMAFHYQRWGDPIAHGDSSGFIGAAIFVVGFGVALVGLWERWKVKH
jgi:hypothetical protein